MARLVRARVKSSDYWPDWAKCCEKAIEDLENTPDLIVDLATASGADDLLECKYCGAAWPKATLVRDNEGLYCDLELLDLDEGEYTVGPAV